MYARAYEQRLTSTTPPVASSTRALPRASTKQWSASAPAPATSATASSPSVASANSSPTKKLSPADIADRRVKGLCFKCDEKYVPGHKQDCRKLFVIEVLDDDDDSEGDPTISLHALIGIQPRTSRTMQVVVNVGGIALRALLDSGSTHNFVDLGAAARAGIPLADGSGLRVAVANGDRLTSPGCCADLNIAIAGEHFTICCYGLALGFFDMVLGVQWFESLGPVLWDFRRRSIAFVWNGRRVLWSAEPDSSIAASLTAATKNVMDELLQQYSGLFADPVGLPPARQRSHRIRLLPGTEFVAVRPYRYAHAQKEELERQCTEMLRLGVIRPSESAFSAPVLLMKKQDGSWRFCVDYRALNDRTIKDKFPIPVVKELLDELRGATFFTKLDLRSGYHQVLMHPDDVEKTAFRTHQGLFEFLVMPFGLSNAPATFQALMNVVLQPFLRWFVLVFFDDILIYSATWSEHLRHVRLVFDKLQEH
jgi:hypothetical protein